MSPVNQSGRAYWRSLDELADTPAFRSFVEKEFPGLAEEILAPATRRSFLKMMGVFLSLAGLSSCRWPQETILPFSGSATGHTPGVPEQYATAMDFDGAAQGLLVTSYDGRPIKIEGNPLHPASRGAATAWAQASLLELYDPDRSRSPIHREGRNAVDASWQEADAALAMRLDALRRDSGRGFAILSEQSSSPTLAAERAKFRALFRQATWHEYEPVSADNAREGARLAFGRSVRTHLKLNAAKILACFDADPLGYHPSAVAYARDFAVLRRTADAGSMSRVYVAESSVSLAGTMADVRLPVAAGRVGAVLVALALALKKHGVPLAVALPAAPLLSDAETRFVSALALDLAAKRGEGLIVVGPQQPATLHALAHHLNGALGAAGRTAIYSKDPDADRPQHLDSIRKLVADLQADAVTTLVILGGNPVYNAPADLDFAAALKHCPFVVHLGLYDDETGRASRWHLPRAHFLESWGDARAWDGTVGVVQPLIEPLYGGLSALELLAKLNGNPASGYALVRETVKASVGALGLEAVWRKILNDGFWEGTALPAETMKLVNEPLSLATTAAAPAPSHDNVEVTFVRDYSVHDGRFSNNPWLQELPDPFSKLTWDNAALLSPATAAALGIRHGDMTKLTVNGRTLEIAAFILPGQPAFSVALPLGYGRPCPESGGPDTAPAQVGFDTYRLRSADSMFVARGATIAATGRSYSFATTQDHHSIDRMGQEERAGRIGALVRSGTLDEYRKQPDFVKHMSHEPELISLWSEPELTGDHQWGMSIDLNTCTGCNACVVACQAENNIPAVGKDQVSRGREMHWLRVDRYFAGDPENPGFVHQPVACHHCENAPCESVCPVAATVHTQEGLNAMVYNRCVGTRYCANNCPYKVRRFNYFNFFKDVTPVEQMKYNPEVTVRARGVMEKCTYCVQRIETTKNAAKNDGRSVKDGEVVPACAQTCPTQAIVFGDLKDPESAVSKSHAHRRSYSMLGELNVKPRTRFLARILNPGEGGES